MDWGCHGFKSVSGHAVLQRTSRRITNIWRLKFSWRCIFNLNIVFMVCRYGQHGCEGSLRDLAVCPLHGHTLHLRHRRQDTRLLVPMSANLTAMNSHWFSARHCISIGQAVLVDMIFLLVQISFIMSTVHWILIGPAPVQFFHWSNCRHRRLYILFRVKRIILLFQISGTFTVIHC